MFKTISVAVSASLGVAAPFPDVNINELDLEGFENFLQELEEYDEKREEFFD